MTGPQAERLSRRLGIHLRRNEFAVCHEILDAAEQEHNRVEKPSSNGMAIAESGLDLRLVNLLEREGYLYMKDLNGVNPDMLQQRCTQLGVAGAAAIKEMLYRVRTGRTRGPKHVKGR